MKIPLYLFVMTLALPIVVHCEPSSGSAIPEQLRKRYDALRFQQGDIELRDGIAKIRVPAEFKYLGPQDARAVLVDIWGNPPGDEPPLGLLVPADGNLLAPNSWAVLIQYEEAGYVKDNDASKINYNDLLKEMQASTREENKERTKNGYPAIELIGWAAPPRYDANEKKLYWAKELKFAGSPDNTLNYNIRILGRRGILILNAIAGVEQLPEIERATPAILRMVDFQQGHRYADFNPSTDKTATYGLAALVAGGVLAKTGFFKVALAGLLAAKKLVIVGLIAAGAFFKKLFGKKEPLA
jgi:uncharacterized membrane-anchored protein